MKKYKIKQLKPFDFEEITTNGSLQSEWLPEKDCWVDENYYNCKKKKLTGDDIHPAYNKYEANIPSHYFELVEETKKKLLRKKSLRTGITAHKQIEDLLKDYTPKGDIVDFPKEVIAKMLEKQVEQGNPLSILPFEQSNNRDKSYGGFNWDETSEGGEFWNNVIMNKDFNKFFNKYPKTKLNEKSRITKKRQQKATRGTIIKSSSTRQITTGSRPIGNPTTAKSRKTAFITAQISGHISTL